MATFIFEGRDKTQRTGHEKIAMRNVRYAIDWIVGEYYNSIVEDGNPENFSLSFDELANQIYNGAMTNLYGPGAEFYNRAPKEMRFAGEKFVRAYIQFKLENDGDVKTIFEVLNK